MYYIQYKLNLKQTPLQSIQVPINFKCPEYRGFTLLRRNSNCNTTSQSVFVSFAMCTERPLLKLKRFILLVMYSWLRAFTAKLTAYTALPCSSSTVTNDALRY